MTKLATIAAAVAITWPVAAQAYDGIGPGVAGGVMAGAMIGSASGPYDYFGPYGPKAPKTGRYPDVDRGPYHERSTVYVPRRLNQTRRSHAVNYYYPSSSTYYYRSWTADSW